MSYGRMVANHRLARYWVDVANGLRRTANSPSLDEKAPRGSYDNAQKISNFQQPVTEKLKPRPPLTETLNPQP